LAPLPRPIGIDRTLVDIATGIGRSARLLPTLSKSEVGAVAVRTAKVRIEFAMARATRTAADTIELGVRTFAIAARQSSVESSGKASNNGVIELEIVAVAATEEREAETVRTKPVKPPVVDPPPTDDPKKKQREAIVRAIELLALPEASAALDDSDRKIFDDFLDKAKAALGEGDLDTAAGWLQEIQQLLDAAARKTAPRARATAPDRRKPAPRRGEKG
jgi:hypothetical protein